MKISEIKKKVIAEVALYLDDLLLILGELLLCVAVYRTLGPDLALVAAGITLIIDSIVVAIARR